MKPQTSQNGQRQLTSDFEAKLEFISQAKQIDYREKASANNKPSNGGNNGFTDSSHNHNSSNGNLKKGQNQAKLTEDNQSTSASTKTSTSRSRLPWVKNLDPIEKSNAMCDIVSVKHLPSANFVTIHHDDSDDSLENTSDDSITEEIVFANSLDYKYDGHPVNGFSKMNNSFENQSSSSDSLTDKTASSSDLIEAHLSITPKNEREVKSI